MRHFYGTATSTCSSSHKLELNLKGLALVCITPMLGGFLYGFDIGATSFVLSMLLSDGNVDDSNDVAVVWWSTMTSVEQGFFVSAMSLGALCGSHLVLLYLSQTIGRRMEIRLCYILYMIGTTLNVLSGTWFQHNMVVGFYMLFLGRLLFGVGVGFIMHGAAPYLAEMCPPQIRGAVVSAKETVIVGGIVIGYAVGNFISSSSSSSDDDNGNGRGAHWTNLYAVSGLLAVPMFFLTFYIPRSKRWLLLHGHREEAYESMKFVYQGDITVEFEHLISTIESKSSNQQEAKEDKEDDESSDDSEYSQEAFPKNEFNQPIQEQEQYQHQLQQRQCEPSLWDPQYRPAMQASMGLIIFQQFSGQPSVLSYATILFQAAGWSGNASVVTATLMMFISMSTVMLVDKVGRKRLLMACCVIMMSSLTALSMTFWGWDGDNENGDTVEFGSVQRMIILIAMFVYIGGYQVGFGPITWCIVSEVFPLEIRGKAIALGVELNYLLNFLVQFLFPVVQDSFGWGPSFLTFGIILGFCLIFIQIFVPETTGLTLEEIQIKLSSRVQNDDFKTDKKLSLPVNEQTALLPDIGGLGADLEEMETQLIRRASDIALSDLYQDQPT